MAAALTTPAFAQDSDTADADGSTTIIQPLTMSKDADLSFGRIVKQSTGTATVTIADEVDNERTFTLVGDDEQDPAAGRIGWSAPLARALRGAAVGELRTVRLPGGEKEWEVLAVEYPAA